MPKYWVNGFMTVNARALVEAETPEDAYNAARWSDFDYAEPIGSPSMFEPDEWSPEDGTDDELGTVVLSEDAPTPLQP